METTIGACGLVCGRCKARIATLASDRDAIEKVAAKWREIHSPDVTAADVWCNGCMSPQGPKCGHVPHCEVRRCVTDKGHSTCADCAEYRCGTIGDFLKAVPHAREVLEALRKAP